MNHPHPLAARSSKNDFECFHFDFDPAELRLARERTITTIDEIRRRLRIGMTEDEARRLALEVFRERGVDKHWHKPYIRFGTGTALTFHEPLQSEYRLRENDPYYIDVGPVWSSLASELEYEGDYGDTFVFGENPEAARCAAAARLLFREARELWLKAGLTGKGIYAFLKKRADETGYRLLEAVDGHRISDFPHQKYSRERLAKLPIAPIDSIWILEIQIVDPRGRFGAFFEDLLI